MVEFQPWMLFLLLWQPNSSTQPALERVTQLYPSRAACEEAGEQSVAARKVAPGEKLHWRCEAVPSSAEFDAVWEKSRRDAGKPQ